MHNQDRTHESTYLDTIFHECRQCGTCCKKIPLEPDETERIKKLGGHVGYLVKLNDFRTNDFDNLSEKAKAKNKIYMIHPDGKGCIFLQKKNDKYYCKIYHYRPKACQGFKCNMADNTSLDLFMNEPMHLLGMNKFGQKL